MTISRDDLPAARWYPDPADPALMRYWDGTAWTAHTAPKRTPAGSRTGGGLPLPGWFSGIAVATQVLLGVAGLVGLGTAWQSWSAAQVAAGWLDDPASISSAEADRLDLLTALGGVATLLVIVVTAAVFITWLYRAHACDRLERGLLRHKSGWAIGAWFVPFLNLGRPAQIVQDVRSAATAGRPGPSGALIGWWWALWLVSLIADRVELTLMPSSSADPGASLDSFRDYVGDLHSSYVAGVVAGLVSVLAAVLAILVVRQITRLVLEAAAR